MLRALPLLLCALSLGTGAKHRGAGRWAGGSAGPASAPSPDAPTGFDAIACKKCMSAVMRLLTPSKNGCAGGNATIIASTSPKRVPTAYCDTFMPKKRQCTAYSFGIEGIWDWDKAMVTAGCKVSSFDPLCCGGARTVGPGHNFIPVALATYDGIAKAAPDGSNNQTIPVLSLRSIQQSDDDARVDLLRLKVSSPREWKGLKNLINTAAIQSVRQLSLNIHFADEDMWSEYRLILSSLKSAGFHPFYVSKQQDAEYLQVQEGAQSLYSRYEVAYGNVRA